MIFEEELIFEHAPFRECHASTIVEDSEGGLLASWFGGTSEGERDVDIWLSRKTSGRWSEPTRVASEEGVPCWNPVLFRMPDQRIWLFYKVGPSPRSWSGAYTISDDDGDSWSEPVLLPAGLLGPIKNKPITLSNGSVLMPTSVEAYEAWTGWVERVSADLSEWTRYGPIAYPGVIKGLIQPTLVEVSSGEVLAYLRSKNIGRICVSESSDFGESWSDARKTELPNPNSGIDAVRLDSGKLVMVYNHTESSRYPLNVAVSLDDGESWQTPRDLEKEPGEYSYPAVIQGRDGMIHSVYTYNRISIKHVVFDEEWASS
jgi:predicted neuraminidase